MTWIDLLYTETVASARERAEVVSKIAEELGAAGVYRHHLKGETKAGRLAAKVYEKLAKEGFKIELPLGLAEDCIIIYGAELEKTKKIKIQSLL